MIITYLGHSCFKIQDKIGPDGITIVTDPFDKTVGFRVPNCEADIVTVSHDHFDHSNVSAIRANPFVIDTPGEYDTKGIMVQGVSSYHDEKEGKEKGENIIFKINIDGIIIVHLGDLGCKLDSEQLEKLTNVDILMIPVGGKYTLDAKTAVEVVSQIEPRIVIPMHYKIGKSKLDIDTVDKFVKEMGVNPTKEEKLKISKKDLPQEDVELIILEA